MKRHYPWLDLVRFIAAFAVVAAHYRADFFVDYSELPKHQQNIFTTAFYLVTRLGDESVLIFFVLSGYLVGGRSLEKILSNKVDITTYAIDRVVRIITPLLASVLLVVLIDLIIGKPIPYIDLLGSLFSVQGIFTSFHYNYPVWSLAYEVWFYVLMGAVMVITRGVNRWSILFAFVLLAIILLIFTKEFEAKYLFVWLIGAFAYFIPASAKPSIFKNVFWLLMLMAAVALSQLTAPTKAVSLGISFLNDSETTILLAVIASLFIRQLIQSQPTNKLAIQVDKTGSKLADFSYSLYLTHAPVISLLSYLGVTKSEAISAVSMGVFAFTIAIALLIAYLVYLSSEKHTAFIKGKVRNWVLKESLK